MMKIVFMGTAEFAVPSLQAIVNAGYDVAAVVTIPDKPSGRGLNLKPSPVKVAAEKLNLKVLQPEKLKDENFINELREINPDVQVVVAFKMLPKSVWEIPAKGTFNLHGSLLPRYRGAAPINHALINGDIETGVTTFLIDDKIDTGNILLRKSTAIYPEENAGDVYNRLMHIGADLVIETLERLSKNDIKPISQDELSHELNDWNREAPKLYKQDGNIDWSENGIKILNRVRGLNPFPGTYTHLKIGDEFLKLKIHKVRFWEEKHENEVGSVYTNGKDLMQIWVENGKIELIEVQPEAKKKMDVKSFLNGLRNIHNDMKMIRL